MFPLIWPAVFWALGGAALGGAVYGFLTMSDEDTQRLADYLDNHESLQRVFIELVKFRSKVRRKLNIQTKRKSGERTIRKETRKVEELSDDVKARLNDSGSIKVDQTSEAKKRLARF